MQTLLRGARVYRDGVLAASDILITDGVIEAVVSRDSIEVVSSLNVLEFNDKIILPGLVDVHVHLREPGFSYKEDVESGTAAAAAGGYTDICSMPNLKPAPDCPAGLEVQLEAIRTSAAVDVHPYGCITAGSRGEQPADMELIADSCIGFSDDGVGVVSDDMMLHAMRTAVSLDKPIAAHCEYKSLKGGDHVNAGPAAESLGIAGISDESEWKMIERDIGLAAMTGCRYHVCHVSTAASVELIRQAKARGVDITCETAPHYVLLDDTCLTGEPAEGNIRRGVDKELPAAYYKMNPPLRRPKDRRAVLEGLLDGTIDMIATDHAPHSWEEKHRDIKDSPMGVVGLECAFPLMYTWLVRTGVMTLDRLVALMSSAPAARFGLESGIEPGHAARLSIWDLDEDYEIDPADFCSKGRATPFEGVRVYGRCLGTVLRERIMMNNNKKDR